MTYSVAGGGWLRPVAALAQHRFATPALAGIAFADSSFLPLPPDLLLVPMALLRPERLRRPSSSAPSLRLSAPRSAT